MAGTRPTILQIIPRLDTGGAELSAIEITAAIVRAGGVALVATEGGRMAGRVTAAGGEIITFPAGSKNPLRILASARALASLIRERQIDLIHARSRAPAWSAWRAARRTGIPFVTTYHGAYAESGRLKRLYNSIMARADLVIANSRYTADLVRNRYGTSDARIRVIHRGVDMTRFDARAVDPHRIEDLRRAWGIPAGRRIILIAARLTGWKGQGVLIDAFARIAGQTAFSDAVLVLAGDAQGREGYADRLRAQIRDHDLAGRVFLVGHVDDIPAAFAAAHVAVVASTEPEAFGRAAAEAEALGCPVIATDIGAPRETVLAVPAVAMEAATGWLVPPGDPAALAASLSAALSLSPADRQAMGQRARDHIAANFTLEAMCRLTMSVYDELLGTRLAARYGDGPSGPGPGTPGRPAARANLTGPA